jgi:putative two-component system response regulator
MPSARASDLVPRLVVDAASANRSPAGASLGELATVIPAGALSGTGQISARELLDGARDAADLAAARSMTQHARVLARTGGQPRLEAEALYCLAKLAYRSGEQADAFAIALDARNLARSSGAAAVEVWALNLIGLVHMEGGNFSDALEVLLHAVELSRATEGSSGAGILLNTVAAIHRSVGDTDLALSKYEAALMANKAEGAIANDAMTLANMAEIRASRGEHLLGVTLSEQALELARQHDEAVIPDILARLAAQYGALGLHDLAESALAESRALLLAIGEPDATSGTLLEVELAHAGLDGARGRLDDAVEHYLAALTIAIRTSQKADELRIHGELASVYKRLGHFELALEHQETRFARHEELFKSSSDLRIKTLQIAHDTEAARQQAEILRLRTGELEAMVRGRTSDLEEDHLEAFQRLALLAERRDHAVIDRATVERLGGGRGGALLAPADPAPEHAAIEHTVRVGDLSADLAAELGEPESWVHRLRLAARLHDIGKVAVADSILLKAGPLTAAEFQQMQAHTTIGSEILAASSSTVMQLAAAAAGSHHERWDGTGYPNAISGTAIPLAGRIVAVADVFDSLTSDQPYRRAWSTIDAVRWIHGASGRQFDPRIVEAFVLVMSIRHPELANELAGLV